MTALFCCWSGRGGVGQEILASTTPSARSKNQFEYGRQLPSSAEEGWTRHQEIIAKPPLWSGRGGAGQEILASTTPSARSKVASQLLLDRAATPPRLRRGVWCSSHHP